MAHGHAMMRTATPRTSAPASPDSGGPRASHATNVTAAATMTAGVNHAEIASAARAMGARRLCASRTRRTICASAVSAPTRVARKVNAPVVLIVAPYTAEPAAFSTGIDSPVSIDSSMADAPSITSPSTGRRSPGRTMTTSPRSTSLAGTSSSMPSRTMRAVRGCRPTRRLMASDVLPRARASSRRPRRTRAMMTTAVSKYTGAAAWPAATGASVDTADGAIVATAEYANAAPVPTAMRVFMSAVRWRKAFQAPR